MAEDTFYFGNPIGGMSSYMLSNTLKTLEGKERLTIIDPKGDTIGAVRKLLLETGRKIIEIKYEVVKD